MAPLAAYPGMMRRDRERLGLRECRAAWLLGLTVREYRVLEAGEDPLLDSRVRETTTEAPFNVLVDFMTVFGRLLGRQVALTPEGLPGSPILLYRPEEDAVAWLPTR